MYVFEAPNKILRKYIEKHLKLYWGETFRCFKNKKSLIHFTEKGKNDWISKARNTPSVFSQMDKHCYDISCIALDRGLYAIYVVMNRHNHERHEKLLDLIEERGGQTLSITGE